MEKENIKIPHGFKLPYKEQFNDTITLLSPRGNASQAYRNLIEKGMCTLYSSKLLGTITITLTGSDEMSNAKMHKEKFREFVHLNFTPVDYEEEVMACG